MPEFGSFALLLALALSGYTLLAGGIALRQLATGVSGRIAPARLAETARRAGIATFVAVFCAAFALVYAAFTDDFSVSYILHHSNRALNPAYKFAALWSGQEGSLLLWALLLTGYGFVLRLRHKVDVTLTAYASTILAGIQIFFLLLLNFAAPPFALVQGAPPADGFGLNPLLQYPEMVIHPPMLYLGYVGFSVPFAFALGALMMRYPGEKWIHITRRWTMVTWLFLTCGIFLGAHWAYSVLGWGGYWGWDPVENASLMPWLTGTAFLHSVMMQEKRGMMKNWNVWLIFSTFMLCILGTDLTRSGLVGSVHAFAQSSIGEWFTGFLVIVLAVCTFTFLLQRDHLKSEHKLESLVSRESSFLFNNLVLLAACFTILWGTLFPIISEYVQGNKVTVGAPFFNRVALPIGLFLLFLTGIGPLLAWRSASFKSVRKNFVLPTVVIFVTAVVLMAAGLRPWNDQATFYSLVAFSLGAGVVTAISSEFLRGAHVISKHTGKNVFASMVQLTRRNTRRYGGYLVHIGVVIIFIGIAGGAFNQSHEQEMNNGQSISIGPYKVVCRSFTQDSNANFDTEYALLDVYRGDKKVTQLAPEKRFYIASQQPSTLVANHSTLLWDLYVIYAGKNPDSGLPIIKVFLNPLMAWIWIGVIVVALGTLVALAPNLSAAMATSRVRSGEGEGRLAARVERGSRHRRQEWRLISRRVLARASQLVLVCIVVFLTAGASDASARFERDSHQMMCGCSCNQLLGECNHVGCPASPGMLNELSVSIARGDSDDAIFHQFSDEYGPVVLASPMFTRFNHVAWIVPPLVLFLGIGSVFLVIRNWKLRTVAMPAIPNTAAFAASRDRNTTGDGTMSTIACGVLVLAIFTFVFFPQRNTARQIPKTRLDFLREQKDVLYDNLRDLNFEYSAGKYTAEDYAAQRAGLENEAAAVLAEIDQLELHVASHS